MPRTRASRRGVATPPDRRWPALVGASASALETLRHQRVLVVGTGSVGGRIVLHLARLGLGELTLCDPKSFKAESLLTHAAYPGDVGRAKAHVVARRCRAIAPHARVAGFAAPVESLPFAEFAEADVVIMAPDQLAVEMYVGQWCLHLGVPLLHAAVHGDTLTAQVRCYGHAHPTSPCPGCFFGPAEWAQLNQQVTYSCTGRTGSSPATDPGRAMEREQVTASFSFLCSVAADLAVNQTLRLLSGLGAPVTDTQIEFCGFTNRVVTSPLARSSACRLDHFQFRRVAVEAPLPTHSPAALAAAGLGRPASPRAVIALSGHAWVERGVCRCPLPVRVERFVPAGRVGIGRCRNCGAPIRPLDFFTMPTVGLTALGEAATKPLHKLGVRRLRGAWVRDADAGVVIVPAAPGESCKRNATDVENS